MKRIFKKAMAMGLLITRALSAQAETLQEVVYLKNGTTMRGTILEQIPEESLKIKATDGVVYVYQMSDVAKITKEKATADSEGPVWEKAPRYRGFVGTSFGVDVTTEGVANTIFFTTHGIQLKPELFVGLGTGIICEAMESGYSFPFYANVRYEMHNRLKRNFSPLADLKTGFAEGDFSGFYFAPSVGAHFYFGESKAGISACIDYTYVAGLSCIGTSVTFDF